MDNIFGLVGRNIDYSFSRGYFTEKFRKLELEAYEYRNFDLPDLRNFREIVSNTPGLRGLNVTIPYKEEVIPFLDTLDPAAAAIGAVNTIRIHKGELEGFNTDAYGFERSLKPHLSPKITHALILGTGGASKAVIHTLKNLGIGVLTVSRDPQPGQIAYREIDTGVMAKHLLIVNATPLGTYPNITDKPPIPYELITSGHLLYDLIYNPQRTAFLKEGVNRGASAVNGYQMLVEQAEKSWEIWNR